MEFSSPNVAAVDIIRSHTELFSHTGIKYNPDKCEITFSSEAMRSLQELIDKVQSSLPKRSLTNESDVFKVEDITFQTAQVFADAMLVSGKGKKAVGRFLERAMSLLKGKKVKPKKVEKIEQRIDERKSDIYDHIYIQYTEGKELKILNETPIIVRPGEKIETMIKSLQTRLKFSRIKK